MAKSPVEHSPVTKADLARFESELSKYFGSHTYSVLDEQFDYEELTSEKINELDKTRKQLSQRIYTELAELQKQKTALQGNSLTSQAWDWARWISGVSAWDDELAAIEDRIKTQNDLLTDLVGGSVFGRTTSNMLKSLDVLLDLDNYSDDGEEDQDLVSPSIDKKPALEIQIPQLSGVTQAAEKITPQASHTSKPHVESPVSRVKVKETSVDEETPRTTQNMLAALLQEAAPDTNASKKPLPTLLTSVTTPLVTERSTGSPLQEQLTVVHTADGDETNRTSTNKPEVQLDTDNASIVVTPEVELETDNASTVVTPEVRLETDKVSTVQLDSQLQSPKDKMVVADGTKPTQMEITSPKEDVREVAEQVTRDIVDQVVASLSTTTDTPVSSPLRDPSSPLKIQTADDGPKATADEQPLVKALNHELMRLQNKAINSKGFSLNMFWHASYQAKADRLERVINSLTGKSQLTDENIKALIKDQTSDLSQALNAHTGLMFGACLPGFTLTTQTGGISSSQARAYLNMQKIVELQEATPVATNGFSK